MNDTPFNYQNGVLYAERVALPQVAEKYGTPCFVYSRQGIEQNWLAFSHALGQHPHLICYAVKANSNLAVLNLLARLGSGFDIVSGGELARVLAAGGQASKTVFSGVGKTRAEMQQALIADILCFNVESREELQRLNQVATEMGTVAPVSLRVNPDVDACTHPYISTGLKENKFGIAIDDALAVYQQAADLPNLRVIGMDCHIGSQLTSLTPFTDALQRLVILIGDLSARGIELTHIDVGGGLGVRYSDEQPPATADYIQSLLDVLGDMPQTLMLEPGRSVVANAGVLLTQVEYLKQGADKRFAIVDAAMNDLIRPSLYSAWMEILPVQQRGDVTAQLYDVVGPVCETGDFLGKARHLAIAETDLLAICGAGAYGFVMSSNYNTRPRAAEILIDDAQMHIIRQREILTDLWRGEQVLPL